MREIIGKLEEGFGRVSDKVLAGYVALECSGFGDGICWAGEGSVGANESINYTPVAVGVGLFIGGEMIKTVDNDLKNPGNILSAIGGGILIGYYMFA